MECIGVIGLGRMGRAIAQRMQAHGHEVTTWTRSGRAVDGVPITGDIGALVAQSDSIILSLLDDTAVAAMLDALLEHDLSGKLFIETSTVVPTLLQDRIDAITAKGALAVDAPISGGPELVAAGACGVFIGGQEGAAARASHVMAALSERIFHVGPLGTGLVMKTINNAMLQSYFVGLGQMMALAKRAGLPLETAIRILSGGPAGIPMVADRIPKILGRDTSIGFTINAALKDADVFNRIAQAHGIDAPTLALFAQMTEDAIAAGLGEKDPAAMISHAYERD